MIPPANPIAAVTHPDPYPYYAELVETRPLYYDAALGLWVASSAAMVTAVLTDERCRVRPVAEPVPHWLLGSPAAAIFGYLVRMDDGAGHAPGKRAVTATLAALEMSQVAEQSHHWAARLIAEHESAPDGDQLTNFPFWLPVYVIGSLLGVPSHRLMPMTAWIDDFVRCLVPTSSPEQRARGINAADQLLDLMQVHHHARDSRPAGLLDGLAQEAQRAGYAGEERLIANAIGFLSQAYEATAGLIGNTLLALAAYPAVQDRVIADPSLLRAVVQEVGRYDASIQNTRRFLDRASSIGGQALRADASILVVLAAANRDPATNPHPAAFDIFRAERRVFTFGSGGHACPGTALAETIAAAGVAQLLHAGMRPGQLAAQVRYRASSNARIPLLTYEEAAR